MLLELQMPEIVIQSNSYIPDANNSFGDDQTYSRFKRKSSMSFTANCSNNNIPLALSNTPPHSYQTNNLNLNQSNSCRSKQQKTNSTSISQSGVAVVSSPIQASVISSNYNNVHQMTNYLFPIIFNIFLSLRQNSYLNLTITNYDFFKLISLTVI